MSRYFWIAGPVLIAIFCAAQQPPGAPSSRSPSGAQNQATQQRFREAVAAYEHGDYPAAEREIKSLLAINPANAEWNELAGVVQSALGHEEDANAFLSKAVRLRPNVAAARTALALNLMRLHREREAEPQFRKAAELAPNDAQANHNLGEFYVHAGRLKEAVPYLKRAQQLQPSDYNNGYDLALACEQTGNLDAARAQLQELVTIKDTAELHSLLGEIEEKAGNYIAAATQYGEAARMDPTEANIFDYGAELLLHQTFDPAIAVFQSGTERYPQSVRLALAYGVALYGRGRSDESAQQFFRVAAANPADPLPMVLLGRAFDSFSPGVANEALVRLRAGVRQFPRNPQIAYYCALALSKQRQDNPDAASPAEIESLLKNAIALDANFGDAYLQLGILYAGQQKYEQAIAQYRQALKLNSTTATIHYRLGQALARSGDTVAAQQEFATFERLRAQETAAQEKHNADIQQFVYTMKNPGGE